MLLEELQGAVGFEEAHVPGLLEVSGYEVGDLESVNSCRDDIVDLRDQLRPSAHHNREQRLNRIVITLHETPPH